MQGIAARLKVAPFAVAYAFLMLLGGAIAQQPNTPSATATWAGVNGPPWPIILPINTNVVPPSITFQVSGTPLSSYTVILAPAGVVTSGLFLGGFGYVDIDLSAGYSFILDGLGLGGPPSFLDYLAKTGLDGVSTWTLPISSSFAGFNAGLQVLIADPMSPSGFTLTAATKITATNTPVSAYFVSSTMGSPTNAGTHQSPFATIQAGIDAAFAAGSPFPQVFVASGSYSEGLQFRNGVSVHGGFHPTLWFEQPGGLSVVTGPATAATAMNITSTTTISRLEIDAADAAPLTDPASSSIALHIQNSTSALVFSSCRFIAGNGGAGLAGTNGNSGGSAGANGAAGTIPAGGAGGTPEGGNGGAAGSGNNPGASGAPGSFGLGQTPGGAGGAGNQCSGPGFNGQPGQNGACGSPGALGALASLGGIVSGQWVPGTAGNGGTGTTGRGGGGGGGGGGGKAMILSACSLNMPGGGGGGGGGYGFPGEPGTGGQNAGSSFGALLASSSPVFDSCYFESKAGGTGGAGGNGLIGGAGGTGGPGVVVGGSPGDGGAGGNGGDGASGGGGAGGRGGSSICVMKPGPSAPTFVGTTTHQVGTGGIGGAGGVRPANACGAAATAPPGPNGTSGTVL